MRTIWKYPLEIKDEQTIHVPCAVVDMYTAMKINQQVLKLDVQNGKPCLWILVDTKYTNRDIIITMYRSGDRCNEFIENYFDSFQIPQITESTYHVFIKEKD